MCCTTRFKESECYCSPKYKFKMTPDEERIVEIDFEGILDEGVQVQSFTVSVSNIRTGQAVALDSDPAIVANDIPLNVGVSFKLSGGTVGNKYRAKVLVTLDNTEVLERAVDFCVRNLD